MKKILFTSLSLFLLFSCGSENSSDENLDNTNDASDSTESSETLVFDQNDYVNDWIEIRESILAGDTITLDRFIETPDTDAESIIGMCGEDWVRDELMEKPYGELIEVDYNGDLVKEFSAEIIDYVDGVEYGSAIFIYLKETKAGLRITGLMAAG